MADAGLSELDRTLIEWRCTRLVNDFYLKSDAGDYQAMAALFTPDGRFARPSAPDKPVIGRDALVAQFEARPAQVRRHLAVNTVITVESAESATGESYVVLYTAPAPAEGATGVPKADPAQLVGTFHDRFVKLDGEWLFADRRGSLALTTAQ